MLNKLIAALALSTCTTLLLAQASAPTVAPAATPVAAPVVRLRGTVEKIEPGLLTVKERSGEVITLVLPDKTPLSEVLPIAMSDIKAGSFIGTAAMPKADGSLEALEVLVFPEAARGTGEGHYPWDLQPQSTMTNATVADVMGTTSTTSSSNGVNTLKLKYKDGEKTLTVSPSTPIVTFKPAGMDLLVVGAKVLVNAQERDGKPTALRILAGRNGFTPPM